MAREFTPKVLTANHLLEGDAIYRDASGGWSKRFEEAVLFHEEREAEAALVKALAEPEIIVGPYLADAKEGPHGPLPVHFREVFRTRGPSNYNHGKQVDLSHV